MYEWPWNCTRYGILMGYVTHVYQSIYTKFVALARSLNLLLLSNFEKSSMLKAILAPLYDVIGRICWHIFLTLLTQESGLQMCNYFLKIRAFFISFWNLWPLATVSSLSFRNQGHAIKELIFWGFSKEHKGLIYMNV